MNYIQAQQFWSQPNVLDKAKEQAKTGLITFNRADVISFSRVPAKTLITEQQARTMTDEQLADFCSTLQLYGVQVRYEVFNN